MKIFKNNAVYVNARDIKVLYDLNMRLPEEMYNKIMPIAQNISHQDTLAEGVLVFNDPDSIKFLKSVEYIADYEKYKNESLDDLLEGVNKIYSEMLNIAELCNSIPDERKKEELKKQHELKELLVLSLGDIFTYKENHPEDDVENKLLKKEFK